MGENVTNVMRFQDAFHLFNQKKQGAAAGEWRLAR